MREFTTRSPEETYLVGKELASLCKKGDILLFYGTLGSGKTTLIQGLVHQLTQNCHDVISPTFVYVNVYDGHETVCHFDLYRLDSDEEFYARAFDEYLTGQAIACIEWPDKVPSLKGTIKIKLSHLPENSRKIEVETYE